MRKVACEGRVAAQSPEAQARRTATKHRHDVARHGWLASSQPAWLNNETYLQKIQPLLASITYSAIASSLRVSMPYAAALRAGGDVSPLLPLRSSAWVFTSLRKHLRARNNPKPSQDGRSLFPSWSFRVAVLRRSILRMVDLND